MWIVLHERNTVRVSTIRSYRDHCTIGRKRTGLVGLGDSSKIRMMELSFPLQTRIDDHGEGGKTKRIRGVIAKSSENHWSRVHPGSQSSGHSRSSTSLYS